MGRGAPGRARLTLGEDTQKSCELDHDYAGSSKPLYVAHYETPDISRLPEGLEKEIQSGRHKSAAVGACSRKESPGFAGFRVVVLLY